MHLNQQRRGENTRWVMGIRDSILTVTVMVGSVAAPLACLALARSLVPSTPIALHPSETPITESVATTSEYTEIPVSLSVTLSAGTEIVAQEMTGIVTRVFVNAGDSLTNGAPVLEVSGITRVALISPSPLYRVLKSGDLGPDVEALQRFLTDVGLFHDGVDGLVGATTVQGIKNYSSRIGLKPQATFQPSWVLWVGTSGPVRLGDVRVVAGRTISPDQTVMVADDGIASVRVVPDGSAPKVPDGFVILVNDEVEGNVSGDNLVAVSGTTVREVAKRLIALDPSSPLGAKVPGVAKSPSPRTIQALPSSAVMAGPVSGQGCVWVVRPNGSYDPQIVVVVGGQIGTTEIAPSVPVGAQVLVNPASVPTRPICPSA